MDYAKIYSAFIADRRLKEPHLSGYAEAHHVVPKAFGGSFSPDNMIKLTPEDHIRAHLLLAKIHGGSMWAPVLALSGECGRRVPSRRAIKVAAMARRHHGEAMSGKGNPFYGKRHSEETLLKLSDQTIYKLRHRDGSVAVGTQSDLQRITGLRQKGVNSLCLRKRRLIHGWFNADQFPCEDPKEFLEVIRESWRHKQKEIALFHLDGSEWLGFPVDAPVQVFTINQGRNCHVEGWFLDKSVRDNYKTLLVEKCKRNSALRGDISGENNPRADQTLYRWRNVETGEVIESKRVEMWKSGRCPKSGVTAIFSGTQKKAGQWEKL